MGFLLTIATGWGWSARAAKLFSWLAPILLLVAIVAVGLALVYRTGTSAGGNAVTVKVQQQHTRTVAEARSDERVAQAATDRIGARVTRADDATTEYLRTTIEDLRNAIDATPPAADGAAAPVFDTGSVSASLNGLVDRANRAAEATDPPR
jgi:ABC-type transporter Mla subunit MlaD